MSELYGTTYNQSGGIRQDLVDVLTKVVKNKAPLLQLMESAKATNTTHLWPYIQVVPTVTGYGGAAPTQNAQVEGATITMASAAAYTNESNYTQILYVPFNISRTQMRVVYAGVPNIVEDQMEVANLRLGQDIENAYVNGVASAGAEGSARQMNGLAVWAAANVNQTGSLTTLATATGNSILETLLQAIYAQSQDTSDFVLCNSADKMSIDGWTGRVTRYQSAEDYAIAGFINVYESSFGAPGGLRIIVDQMVPSHTIIAGELSSLKQAYLDEPQSKELATIADGQNYYSVAETTLEVRNPVSVGCVVCS